MNEQIILEKDDSKGVTRVRFFDGDKKSHVGDIAFDTSEFTVCPDLVCPERMVPVVGRLLGRASDSLNTYTTESGLLLISVFVL